MCACQAVGPLLPILPLYGTAGDPFQPLSSPVLKKVSFINTEKGPVATGHKRYGPNFECNSRSVINVFGHYFTVNVYKGKNVFKSAYNLFFVLQNPGRSVNLMYVCIYVCIALEAFPHRTLIITVSLCSDILALDYNGLISLFWQ